MFFSRKFLPSIFFFKHLFYFSSFLLVLCSWGNQGVCSSASILKKNTLPQETIALSSAAGRYMENAQPVRPQLQALRFLSHKIKTTRDLQAADGTASAIFKLCCKLSNGDVESLNGPERNIIAEGVVTATNFLKVSGTLNQQNLLGLFSELAGNQAPGQAFKNNLVAGVIALAFRTYTGLDNKDDFTKALTEDLAALFSKHPDLFSLMWAPINWSSLIDTLPKNKGFPNLNSLLQFNLEKWHGEEVALLQTDKSINFQTVSSCNDFLEKQILLIMQQQKDEKELTLDSIEFLADILQKTSLPQMAEAVVKKIMVIIMANVDFRILGNIHPTVINALISAEAYRILEVQQGGLTKSDPDIFDYQKTNQSAASEANLLMIVSCIQNYFSRNILAEGNTDEDLRQRWAEKLLKLFGYQLNSRKLAKPEVRRFFKSLPLSLGACLQNGGEFDQGSDLKPEYKVDFKDVTDFISDRILKAIPEAQRLKISVLQKLALDGHAEKQELAFYSLPSFDMDSLQKKNDLPRAVYRFGSDGSLNQCGFFSLGMRSRDEAIEFILDNLEEPEILALVDKNISGNSADIKSAIECYLKHKDLPPKEIMALKCLQKFKDAEKYFELYLLKRSKEQGSATAGSSSSGSATSGAINKGELFQKFIKDYLELAGVIAAMEKILDENLDSIKQQNNWNNNDHADLIAAVKQSLDLQKWQAQSALLSFVYPMDHLKQVVKRSIEQKFSAGLLEFDPTPSWSDAKATYPQILAKLYGINISNWVSMAYFASLQQRNPTVAIHETEDQRYCLVDYLHGDNAFRSVNTVNISGLHYEKLIEAGDYCAIAKAIRHQNAYGKSGCTRDTGLATFANYDQVARSSR